ncbi:hypothetical protein F5X68DRAFT_78409 [Plectosphaerella plurivora]|uniref:Cx9C motif-containing protein 4, mitochondrial n=1 Tax=Plectosphaerella plurivora TaxID=936078 RepID=A0A9P8VG17_9PEZI|nr:hypothetical protein F5X68DRAFT_78409 [Plectosphaerella plurivora]
MADPAPEDTRKPACHRRACAIQSCLTKNGYDEAKCQSTVLALYKCCSDFYNEHGDSARSPSCPKPDLLKLKLSRLEGQDGA